MVKEIKISCYDKFVKHKKILHDKDLEEIDDKLKQLIEKKLSEAMKYQMKEYFTLNEEKNTF